MRLDKSLQLDNVLLLTCMSFFIILCRGVGLNFFGYTPKLSDFAARVSQDIGDLSFWSSIHPSVIENSKDRLLRTFRSCTFAFYYNVLVALCVMKLQLSIFVTIYRGERAS